MDANRDLARQWVTKAQHTHDLLLLLERILPSNAPVEKLRDDLALLTPYAVEIRYPDEIGCSLRQTMRTTLERLLNVC
jgi:hypothetical protein